MSGATRGRVSSWWRLWLLQASWNPKTMQSLGMLVAALPWLRRQPWDAQRRAGWAARELEFRNTNPYAAGLALGASLRLHELGPPEVAWRLEPALDRAVAAVGDAFFWSGIIPAIGLLTAAAAVAISPWIALLAWGAFAAAQAWLRSRCLALGYDRAAETAALLGDGRVHRAVTWARRTGLVGAGTIAAVVAHAVVTAAPGTPGWTSPLTGALLLVGAAAAGIIAAWRGAQADRLALVGALALWAGARGAALLR
jgi:mannose/fructose/N-acetylgalactosamine-specific phosphotransferase system component IID